MSQEPDPALAQLDAAARRLRAARVQVAEAMDDVKAAMLAADQAGVTRELIVKRSGVSLRTAYKIFPVERSQS